MAKKRRALTQIRLYNDVKSALSEMISDSKEYPKPSLQKMANIILHDCLVEKWRKQK